MRINILVVFTVLAFTFSVTRAETAENANLELVFLNCPYSIENISEITGYTSYESRYKQLSFAATTEEVFNFLNTWKGRDIWLGYEDQVPKGDPWGFDLPDDIEIVGRTHLILKTNIVDGELLENDPTMISLYKSESTGMIYVLPFRSLVSFARSNGQNSGAHLCGIAEVDSSLFLELKSMLEQQELVRNVIG